MNSQDHEHLQEAVFAHPDGKPHAKACSVCAFRRDNPQKLADEDFDWMFIQRDIGGFTFFCVHRDEDGYSRECACWAATQRGRALAATSSGTGPAAADEGGGRGQG